MEKYLQRVMNLIDLWCRNTSNIYIERDRSISMRKFFEVMVSLTLIAASYAKALADNNLFVSKSSFHKFRNKIPVDEFKDLSTQNRKLLHHSKILPQQSVFSVDGSKIAVTKKLCSSGYTSQKNQYFGQGLLSLLVEVTTKIPYEMLFSAQKDERLLAQEHLKVIPKASIVIFDRGYYSFSLAKAYIDAGVYLVMRMKKNHSAVKEALQNKSTDYICTIEQNGETIQMRIVTYKIDTVDYYIATTLNKKSHPLRRIKELYWSRWHVEEQFKFFKGETSFDKFHSQTENGIKQEMYLTLFLSQISRTIEYLGAKAGLIKTTKKPNKSTTTKKKSATIKKFNSKVLYCETLKQIRAFICQGSHRVRMTVQYLRCVLKHNIISYEIDRKFPRIVRKASKKMKYVLNALR